jgi:hypothetical protein
MFASVLVTIFRWTCCAEEGVRPPHARARVRNDHVAHLVEREVVRAGEVARELQPQSDLGHTTIRRLGHAPDGVGPGHRHVKGGFVEV